MERGRLAAIRLLCIFLLLVGVDLWGERWFDYAYQTVLAVEDDVRADKNDDQLGDQDSFTATQLTATDDLRRFSGVALLAALHRAIDRPHDPANALRAPPA